MQSGNDTSDKKDLKGAGFDPDGSGDVVPICTRLRAWATTE